MQALSLSQNCVMCSVTDKWKYKFLISELLETISTAKWII